MPFASTPLLFEIIRSFSVLARTLNLSHAVKELGSTRQTVRRHIRILEDIRGEVLFNVIDRRYELTEAGRNCLPEAEEIILRGNAWLRGQHYHVSRLQYLSHREQDGWFIYQQQQSLGQIWTQKSCLMREVFRAWAMCGGNIEAPEIQHVRPYLIVYRHTDAGWICVEFGEKSHFVNWYGLDKARSSIGHPIGEMPGGEEFARMLEQPFYEIEVEKSARLDHIFTKVPSPDNSELVLINYRRLILGGQFPDGSPALFSCAEPSTNLTIKGVDSTDYVQTKKEHQVEFNERLAKYGK